MFVDSPADAVVIDSPVSVPAGAHGERAMTRASESPMSQAGQFLGEYERLMSVPHLEPAGLCELRHGVGDEKAGRLAARRLDGSHARAAAERQDQRLP